MRFGLLALIFIPFVLLVFSGCSECKPDCNGRCCGDDGCGGTCSHKCPDVAYWECDPNTCECIRNIYPDCAGRCCGDDGAGGECPDECPEGTHCDPYVCVCERDQCTTKDDCIPGKCCVGDECQWPDCSELECGPDPVCGKECGPCPVGDCIDGICQ